MNTREWIDYYKSESSVVFSNINSFDIEKFVKMIFDCYENEGTVFMCGNGGNVASVQNFVVDLNMHPFVSDDKSKSSIKRNKFKAVSLCSDQATITGISNDLGFEYVFSKQLEYQGFVGDILFGMSGSGNSKNIIEAFKIAKQKGMLVVLMTRNATTKCDEYADLIIRLQGQSIFPGQTGSNNNNFHYEDNISKISHIVVGLLKDKVQHDNRS